MQERHLRPWELGQLTISEVVVYLEDDKPADPGGAPNQSYEELIEYARWWQSLTPLERLRNAERGNCGI